MSYNTRLVADLRQLMTLRQHYYPEGGWGWLVLAIGFLVQGLSHGLHMAIGVLITAVTHEFRQNLLYAGNFRFEITNLVRLQFYFCLILIVTWRCQ